MAEIERIHREYELAPRTRYNTTVTSVKRAENTSPATDDQTDIQSQWIINDGRDGVFDAVIVTVGTCGEPNMVTMEGMPGWKDEQERKESDKRRESKTEDHNSGSPSLSNTEKPTQDDTANGHGSDLGVWEATRPKENAWDIGRDQTIKREQGFPKPSEAFSRGEDPQKPVEEVLGEGLHDMVRNAGSVVTGRRSEKQHAHEKRAPGANGAGPEDADVYKGPILHSSGLDREDAPPFEGKTIVVIGSGASAVEAVETALSKGAKKCIILARKDKAGHMRASHHTRCSIMIMNSGLSRGTSLSIPLSQPSRLVAKCR